MSRFRSVSSLPTAAHSASWLPPPAFRTGERKTLLREAPAAHTPPSRLTIQREPLIHHTDLVPRTDDALDHHGKRGSFPGG